MASSTARSRRSALAILALACGALGACVEVDERPAQWSYIHAAIIAPNCTSANCHTDITRNAGISFDDPDESYQLLAGVDCDSGEPAEDFVVANEPELSKLLYLLRGEETLLMPPDVPLPEAEIELVERWIAEGAQCN
ncbi:hypothetical protein [Haliangium ochraceum]|uniref:Cytochrome C Planctomycete-type domain-containing protein n=1 Tax=Haliangium ochraceum (strain DSM 14365 / JCM 11303 / SMP-2) TaxID=502025 RepID=D0LGD1_HALO1|nr:hypothetical protein [Haliangium ochraceum]ACY18156.1 conserved hypothetical protein [Haliangium ochraceum DSM 14365]